MKARKKTFFHEHTHSIQKRDHTMLCPTCGENVLFQEGIFTCKACDCEFDLIDVFETLIPEPVFVVIKLDSCWAIIDVCKQQLSARVDTMGKAELTASLLNKNLAQNKVRKQLNKHFGH